MTRQQRRHAARQAPNSGPFLGRIDLVDPYELAMLAIIHPSLVDNIGRWFGTKPLCALCDNAFGLGEGEFPAEFILLHGPEGGGKLNFMLAALCHCCRGRLTNRAVFEGIVAMLRRCGVDGAHVIDPANIHATGGYA